METCSALLGQHGADAHDRVATLDARGQPTLSRGGPTARCVRPRRKRAAVTHGYKRTVGERAVPTEEPEEASDECKHVTHTHVSMTEQRVGH
jgi:hypothetical protein